MNRAMGTTRNTRSIRALRADALTIDARSERTLLAQLAPTAALFNFFDERDRFAGRWDEFFTHVPMVRYALLSETDLGRQTAILRASLSKLGVKIDPQDAGQRAAVANILQILAGCYRRIDADAVIFATWPEEYDFASSLDNAIQGVLAGDLQNVAQCADWLDAQPSAPAVREIGEQADHAYASISSLDLQSSGWNAAGAGPAPPDGPEAFVRSLTQATWSTHATITQLVHEAQSRFAALAANPSALQPHFALYLAFVRQFAGAQQAINQIPSRHRDFFYRNLLRLSPAGPVPDTTYVAFTAAPGAWRELPAGTALTAEKDAAGQPILYRTARPVIVAGSNVARLATVQLTDAWQPGSSGFYCAPIAASTNGLGAPLAPGASWATFGEPQPPLPAPRSMADASSGFAVNSPVLHLEEGERTISLEFAFVVASPATDATETIKTLNPNQLPFAIDYSGAKGWAAVSPDQITCSLAYTGATPGAILPGRLIIGIALHGGSPPCVNYDPKSLGAGFDARSPVLRVRYVNPLAAFCGLDRAVSADIAAAFASAPVSRLAISVTVAGARNLVLAGPTGQFAPGKPFPPFGSPPMASSTFVAGKVEVFRKRLDALSLTVGWQGLPTDPALFPDGLRDYYEDYLVAVSNPSPQMFRNDQYRAHFSGLSNRAWQPLDLTAKPTPKNAGTLFWWQKDASAPVIPPAPPVPPATADGVLASTSTWAAQPALLAALPPDPGLADPLVFSPATTTGFVGLTLVAPDYLFGQQLYPTVVSTVALDNAMAVVSAGQPDKKKAAIDVDSPTAFTLLRVPVRPSWLGRIWAEIHRPSKTTYTFNSRLFPAVAKTGAFPADVSAQIAAAGAAPAAVFAALPALAGKTFADLAGFEAVVSATLGLDPQAPPATDARDAVTYWLARLLYPKPPPAPSGLKPMPPPPLVPTIADVAIDYAASTVIDLIGGNSTFPLWETFWQMAPQATFRRKPGAAPLLVSSAPGGHLYIGLENVAPPETIALLFVMEAVPASALATMTPDIPVWSALAGDSWTDVQSAVHDGTHGFLRTGIIRIDLPDTADTAHTVMPAGFTWLRASVATPAAHLRTLQVLPHAVEAAWAPPSYGSHEAALESSAAHFAQPLPAGAITGLETADPAVKQVLQPLAATGGRPAETEEDFATRVSERLRHKGRAVAPGDYERITLETFSSVFSARTVPAADAAGAGTVTLVVLPALPAPPAVVPPGFVTGDLLAMQSMIAKQAPLSAKVRVTNPSYEKIQLTAEVLFTAECSFAFQRAELISDLKAFISPWIYDQANVLDPVRSFHLSDFSAFMRALPYVKEVGACQLFETGRPGQPLEWVAPSSALALLISAENHDIRPLS